jgi:hypothetical protein
MQVLIATTNEAKVERYKFLFAHIGNQGLSPMDLGLTSIDVEEGTDIEENARIKAGPYLGQTDLPILSNDVALYLDGVALDPALTKRNALEGMDESQLTQIEIRDAIIAFYKRLVQENGGPIPGVWRDVYVLTLPDGTQHREISERHILLTDKVVGEVHPYFPMRSMYINVPTGKYAAQQSEEEHLKDMQPIIDALQRLMDRLN